MPKKTRKSPDGELLTSLVETAIEKLDALGSRMEGVDKKLDLHIQKTEFQFNEIAKLDADQNRILEEHHQRSTELKRDNDLKERELKEYIERKDAARKIELEGLSRRVARVEVPQKVFTWTRKAFVWIAAASGAVVAVAALLNWIRGI